MKKDMLNFQSMLQDLWSSIYEMLPVIAAALIVFFTGFFIIKRVSRLAANFINKRTKDGLVADFLVNIFFIILIILLIVFCLGILGWGHISDKILAGAGITTFIIGFALKDIGENFLAGILMAFNRPFTTGDFIEIDKIRGRVLQVKLRETTVKTLDGKIVFIPNSMVIKQPLTNFTTEGFLRNEFVIGVDYNTQMQDAIETIHEVLRLNEVVEKTPLPQVYIEDFAASSVNIKVNYWYSTTNTDTPGPKLKSDIMQNVLQALNKKQVNIPTNIIEVKMAGKPVNGMS